MRELLTVILSGFYSSIRFLAGRSAIICSPKGGRKHTSGGMQTASLGRTATSREKDQILHSTPKPGPNTFSNVLKQQADTNQALPRQTGAFRMVPYGYVYNLKPGEVPKASKAYLCQGSTKQPSGKVVAGRLNIRYIPKGKSAEEQDRLEQTQPPQPAPPPPSSGQSDKYDLS